MDRLDPVDERRFWDGVDFIGRFHMEQSEVHKALHKLVAILEREGIPYAIVGAMALAEYGFRRATEDVDVLLTPAGLHAFKAAHLGRGYVEKFSGSKGLRDTEHGIKIDVLLTGEYPGDGKPKPVRFPDPCLAERGRVALLPIELIIELKLASGMTAPHRLKDLADVIELIRARGLSEDFASRLDPYVQPKFREMWAAAQVSDPE